METPPTPADGLMLPRKSQLQRFAGWTAQKTALSTDCGNSGPNFLLMPNDEAFNLFTRVYDDCSFSFVTGIPCEVLRYLSKESWTPSHSHWLLQWSRLASTFFLCKEPREQRHGKSCKVVWDSLSGWHGQLCSSQIETCRDQSATPNYSGRSSLSYPATVSRW